MNAKTVGPNAKSHPKWHELQWSTLTNSKFNKTKAHVCVTISLLCVYAWIVWVCVVGKRITSGPKGPHRPFASSLFSFSSLCRRFTHGMEFEEQALRDVLINGILAAHLSVRISLAPHTAIYYIIIFVRWLGWLLLAFIHSAYTIL